MTSIRQYLVLLNVNISRFHTFSQHCSTASSASITSDRFHNAHCSATRPDVKLIRSEWLHTCQSHMSDKYLLLN